MSIRSKLAGFNPFKGFFNNGQVPINVEGLRKMDAVDEITSYEARFTGLSAEWKYFRSNGMLKRCVLVVAATCTNVSGFETVLESPSLLDEKASEVFEAKYRSVKEYIDRVNKQVNMDKALFTALVNLQLYGKAAFEKVRERKSGKLLWLKTLKVANSDREGLQPVLNDSGRLVGFEMPDKKLKFTPEKVLYFVNNDLDESYQGLSDVEPLIIDCISYADLKRKNPRILDRTHDPYVIVSVDTSDKTFPADSIEQTKQATRLQEDLQKLLNGINSGSNIVTNNKVTTSTQQLKVDLPGVVGFKREFEDYIIAVLGVPRFLVNRPDVNRATAESEFTAFVENTIAPKQRYLKREMEKYYDELVRQFLHLPDEEPLPVRVKHVWRDIETGNLKEKIESATLLYGNGMGLLAESPETAMKVVGLLTDEVKQALAPPSPPVTV